MATAKGDILWRDDAGHTSIWEMNGGQSSRGSISASSVRGRLAAAGSGLDGDGKSDILCGANNAGHTSIWEMNGGRQAGIRPQPHQSGVGWPGPRLSAIDSDARATSYGATTPGTPRSGKWDAGRSSRVSTSPASVPGGWQVINDHMLGLTRRALLGAGVERNRAPDALNPSATAFRHPGGA